MPRGANFSKKPFIASGAKAAIAKMPKGKAIMSSAPMAADCAPKKGKRYNRYTPNK